MPDPARLHRSLLLPILSILLLVSQASGLWAQGRRQRPQIPKERLKTSAKFEGLQRGLLHVVTEEGDQWLLKLEAKPQDISYYAEAEKGWLRPGMLVQFSGDFNKEGESLAPIRLVHVISPRETTRFGVVPEGGGGLEGAQDLFRDPSAPKKSVDSRSFQVVGKLAKLRNDKMTVFAGTPVQVKLADEARVSVDLADIRLLRPGDSVEVEGWYLPSRMGLAVINRITVRAAEPLKVPKKKARVLPGQKPNEPTDANAREAAGDEDDGNPFQVE